jgi:N-acetylglucosaminyl-diphospho-decaprenol L-rhamnosyltransferase
VTPLTPTPLPPGERGFEPPYDLAIVIVSWNVRDLLRRCLEAVAVSLAGSGISYRMYVVDNASADGTPAMLREHFPHVELIESGANIGFAAGNNLALRAIVQHATCNMQHVPSYVLLLNPDTEPVGDAIPQLVRWLATHPEAVAVGPQLRYTDGSVQSSRRRFPTRLTLLWESTPLERFWPTNPWAQRYRMADTADDAIQPVGWLVGAAILFRAGAIQSAGLLDERFFMYSEELEWQYRMQHAEDGNSQTDRYQPLQRPTAPQPRAAPFRPRFTMPDHDRDLCKPAGTSRFASLSPRVPMSSIWYLPSAVITHYEGKSSEQAVAARYVNFHRSKLRLAQTWFGWGYARLLRLLLRLGFAFELAVETAKLLVGHRPDLRRQRVQVYRHVLRAL